MWSSDFTPSIHQVLAATPLTTPYYSGLASARYVRDGLSSCVRQIRNCDQIHRPTSDHQHRNYAVHQGHGYRLHG
jgi:hypothetical protein